VSGISAATIALSGAAASAAGPHPWCMVYQEMTGTVSCYYDQLRAMPRHRGRRQWRSLHAEPGFPGGGAAHPASVPRRRHDR
jgi:hypothetical protein